MRFRVDCDEAPAACVFGSTAARRRHRLALLKILTSLSEPMPSPRRYAIARFCVMPSLRPRAVAQGTPCHPVAAAPPWSIAIASSPRLWQSAIAALPPPLATSCACRWALREWPCSGELWQRRSSGSVAGFPDRAKDFVEGGGPCRAPAAAYPRAPLRVNDRRRHGKLRVCPTSATSPETAMEISPLRQQLADLSSRADALRRYL